MGRPTVLLADDHRATRDMAARILSTKFEVICQVGDGRAAVVEIKSLKPDVVVLDLSMPVLGGIDVTKQFSRDLETPRFVFMTVHEDPDFLKEAIDAGALGYVLKRNMASELLEAVGLASLDRMFISPSMFRDSRY